MATRTSIETKISAITDGGANTASEVRAVLTELLDYTENPAPVPTVQTFSIGSDAPFTGNLDFLKLFVSIRGIVNEFATMTILFKSSSFEGTASNDILFVIPFDQASGDFTLENFNMLAGEDNNSIIPLIDTGNYLMYSLPSTVNNSGAVAAGTAATTSNATNVLFVTLARTFQNYTNSLIIGLRNPSGDMAIETSVCMHSKKFSENLNDNIGKNKTVNRSRKVTAFEELFSF